MIMLNKATLASKEKDLWNDAIFVFDTSALLDLYALTLEQRKNIIDNNWNKHLNSRLWMPGHVETEYNSNRESVISKIFSDNYPVLIKNMETTTASLNKLKDCWDAFNSKLDVEGKHPTIEKEKLNICMDALKTYIEKHTEFANDLQIQIDNKEKNIQAEINSDDLFDAINLHFEKGEDFSYDEMIEIIKNEGMFRYSISVPPGYKDSGKSGLQVYGDLYVWKQIMNYAHDKKRNIIFICDDLKEDWCLKEKRNPERIEEPRPELVKEMYDFAGVDFWMYSLSQFIYLSNKYFSTDIDIETVSTIDSKIKNSMVFNFKDTPYAYLYHVPKGWAVIDMDSKDHSLLVKNGTLAGRVPYDKEPDRSWLCDRCHEYGPWNGNRCLNCGNLQAPYE